LKRLEQALADQVEEVKTSTRLSRSAACIVLSDQELGYQMKEMLKATGQELPETKPVLEVNLEHPLLQRLSDESDEDAFARLALLVHDQAVLAEGRQLENPARFVQTLNELLLDMD